MNANSFPEVTIMQSKSSNPNSSFARRSREVALAIMLLVLPLFVLTTAAPAQIFTVLHTFTGADGASPMVGLAMDAAGNLYGTTVWGGSGGVGTVFKLTRSGTGWILNTLHSFTGGDDGAYPDGRVMLGQDGSLYGTTLGGGRLEPCPVEHFQYGPGCGVVFQLKPPPTAPKSVSASWNETVLYRFSGGSDGATPQGDLIFDQSGDLYGTTMNGGAAWCTPNGCGVIYELTPSNGSWKETVLYSPPGHPNLPSDGVVFDPAGNLYGVFSGGQGAIYELSRSGSSWTEQLLHTFAYEPPVGGLIFDSSGNLYGTTNDGGTGGGGTVFQLTPGNGGSWNLTTLYNLSGQAGYRTGPVAKLIMDKAGNLYGTTRYGGAGRGNVFRLAPSNGGWIYTSLHDFSAPQDQPLGSLILDAYGNLYGTASALYNQGGGIVFEITP